MAEPIGSTDDEAPGWHRLAREAHHRAEGYWLARQFGFVAVCFQGGALGAAVFQGESTDPNLWVRTVTSVLFTALAVIQYRRWTTRAAWLASTPSWWERDDEMPTILPFPRVSLWLNDRLKALNGRLTGSWIGRTAKAMLRRS